MKPILIVDYGMANLRSVQKAFEKVGHAAEVSGDPNRVAECERLVLPGVGAFRDAIARLNESGLAEPIREHVRRGRKLLGICLGLQLLFDVSYEDGEYRGLGLFPGKVVRFPDVPGLKVPHMGWNQLTIRQRVGPLSDTRDGDAVYFVHAYHAVPRDERLIAAAADYPAPFCAAIACDNVAATQFHPEKSQRIGLTMLRRFAEWD
jgi:imidazole glycerol-phosphate synthase subunit HisH